MIPTELTWANGRLQVLAIEDSPGDLRLIRHALTRQSQHTPRLQEFQLSEASYLGDGLELLQSRRFDAILLDLNLPDSSGIETLLKVRDVAREIPIVILSCDLSEDLAREAVRLGAQDYLFKDDLSSRVLSLALCNAIERAEVGRANQSQRERIFRILDGLSDAIVILDDCNFLEFLNQAAKRLLATVDGWSGEVGKAWDIALPNDGVREISVTSRDGSHLVLEAKIESIQFDRERLSRCISLHDITEHKKLQQTLERARIEAERASKLKSDFIALISHELRTPLNGVIGMTSLLAETNPSETQLEYIEAIRASGDLLMCIINDLLDLSKIESGKMELEEVEFDLGLLIEETVELLTPQATEKGLVLGAIVPPEVRGQTRGDPTRIQQILLNLIGNAIKFTESGFVFISAKLQAPSLDGSFGGRQYFQIEVEDSGSGVAAEEQSRLFQPFVRAKNSVVGGKDGGTGLGLSISRRLVELMEGTIGLRSVEGVGSTFWIAIPARISQGSGTRGDLPTAALLAKPDHRSAIAVQSDNTYLTQLLQRQLEPYGFDVFAWQEGSGTHDCQPDLLVIDEVFSAEARPFSSAESVASGQGGEHPLPSVSQTSHRHGKIPRFYLAARPKVRRGRAKKLENAFQQTVMWPIRQSDLIARLQGCRSRQGVPLGAMPSGAKTPNGHSLDCSGSGRRSPRHGEEGSGYRRFVSENPILIVDDNPVNRKVAVKMCERLGTEAVEAASGPEALTLVAERPFSLVLMDCLMPGMDGYEVTSRIRVMQGAGRHIPIVALTAFAVKENMTRCFAAGMDDYITKPVKLEHLETVLGRFLQTAEGVAPPSPIHSDGKSDGQPRVVSSLDLETVSELKHLGDTAAGVNFFQELLRIYMESSPPILQALKESASKNEHGALQRLAHRLKGASGNIGAKTLAARCAEIENFARENQNLDYILLVESLENEYSKTLSEFMSLNS